MLRVTAALLLVALCAALPIPQPNEGGKRWALIIAGSNTWGNYRHQADAYHAYQIVKKGGIADENIVMFHYDDIANNEENPKKGTVINSPTSGENVYEGVPKDYTGADVNAKNFLAALAGKSELTTSGNGKVIASGPDDTVFVYYTDHGGPGILGMPSGEEFLYGKDIVSTLKAKHEAKGYKEMVFYIEACESGSIFEGTLPADIKIYATTASNAQESSWGCYCPGMPSPPPSGYNTCLGDLYSVAWLENTDSVNRHDETLDKQYTLVKERVSQNGTYQQGSHVMQYGELDFDTEDLDVFLGQASGNPNAITTEKVGAVDNRDADLLYLASKSPALLSEELSKRATLDNRMLLLATAVGGHQKAEQIMSKVHTPVVENWECYKANVNAWQSVCGPLRQYGMKHGRTLANLCNEGHTTEEVVKAAKEICA